MQPTARSASQSSSATGTEPPEWDRSQSTSAPASCAMRVSSAPSARYAERYATWLSTTRAVRSVTAAASRSAVTPAEVSTSIHRRVSPHSRATPSATYRSVGKLSRSSTISVRPGRAATAARISL